MRLVVSSPYGLIAGGAQTYLRGLLPAIREAGHELALVIEREPSSSRAHIADHVPDVPRWVHTDLGDTALIEQIRAWKPDLLYHHGFVNVELERRLMALVPTVFFAHGYYGTCATGTKCHRWPTTQPCFRTLGPMCLAINYARGCGLMNPKLLWNSYRRELDRNDCLHRFQAIVVGSRYIADEMGRHLPDASVIHRIPLPLTNVVPLPDPPADRPLTGRVAFVGRVTIYKGGEDLVEALALASAQLGRRLTLVIAGNGPSLESVLERARKLAVPVESLGWVAGEKLPDVLSSVDVLAFPSLMPETFGLVGLEAGAFGTPTVGYARGGVSDWLLSNETGEPVAEPATPKRLADGLVRALRDPDYRNRLGRGAWKAAREATVAAHWNQLEPVLLGVARKSA